MLAGRRSHAQNAAHRSGEVDEGRVELLCVPCKAHSGEVARASHDKPSAAPPRQAAGCNICASHMSVCSLSPRVRLNFL
jgi:hypothetical protein